MSETARPPAAPRPDNFVDPEPAPAPAPSKISEERIWVAVIAAGCVFTVWLLSVVEIVSAFERVRRDDYFVPAFADVLNLVIWLAIALVTIAGAAGLLLVHRWVRRRWPFVPRTGDEPDDALPLERVNGPGE